jgi:hypothetical protein
MYSNEQRGAAVRATLARIASLSRRAQFRTPGTCKANAEVVPMLTTPTALQLSVRSDSSGLSPQPPRRPGMKAGDVLVSRPTARADVYEISVVPSLARLSDARYEDGRETGRQLARRLAVDGWFTCDHTHFVRIATYRL